MMVLSETLERNLVYSISINKIKLWFMRKASHEGEKMYKRMTRKIVSILMILLLFVTTACQNVVAGINTQETENEIQSSEESPRGNCVFGRYFSAYDFSYLENIIRRDIELMKSDEMIDYDLVFDFLIQNFDIFYDVSLIENAISQIKLEMRLEDEDCFIENRLIFDLVIGDLSNILNSLNIQLTNYEVNHFSEILLMIANHTTINDIKHFVNDAYANSNLSADYLYFLNFTVANLSNIADELNSRSFIVAVIAGWVVKVTIGMAVGVLIGAIIG